MDLITKSEGQRCIHRSTIVQHGMELPSLLPPSKLGVKNFGKKSGCGGSENFDFGFCFYKGMGGWGRGHYVITATTLINFNQLL